MSRALVIKGANFESNRVTQITFDNDIPCTALAFGESSYAITSMATGTAVTVTKTPANTTDELVVAVTDTAVARYENGYLYAVGFGTTTLTATCGSVTASATVSVTELVFTPTIVSEKRIQRASTAAWPDEQPVQMSSNSSYFAIVDDNPDSSEHNNILSTSDYSVIMIPANTARIVMETSVTVGWTSNVRYATTESPVTGYTMYAKYISYENLVDSDSTGDATLTVPEGANCIAAESNTITSSDVVTITFYNS